MSRWLTTAEFAGLAAMNEVNARKALRRALQLSKPWNGAALAVRLSAARGGPRGLGYEVRADSLPAGLQERLKDTAYAAPDAGEGASAETTRRSEIVGPIVHRKAGSAERREAFHAVMIARQIPRTTLRRWVRESDEAGIAGLRRKARSDKGEKRSLISQCWFKEASQYLDRAAVEKIHAAMSIRIRSQWREPAAYIIQSAGHVLRKLTIDAGYVVTGQTPARMFEVPRAYVVRHRIHPRRAATFLDARKRRDLEPALIGKPAERPGAMVDIDAMHFDHTVLRPDGTAAYPKAIVFADNCTHRATVVPFLLGPGQSIRQQHVALAIAHFFAAEGVPETIRVDHGREFAAVDDLAEVLQLVAQIRSTVGRAPIVRPKPHAPRSKVVENVIGVLQRTQLAGLPGHVGNNRINRVTQQAGRPTLPFGMYDKFTDAVQLCVHFYNERKQHPRGRLQGRSPNEVLQAHIEAASFERHGVDRASLELAFSRRLTRQVHPYGIKHAGRWWTCPALYHRAGETIGILEHRFSEWPAIPLYDLADPRTIIGYAEPHTAVDTRDPANAKESAWRKRAYHANARELLKSAGPYDPVEDRQMVAGLLPPAPVAPIAGTIVPNEQAAEIVKNITEPAGARAARKRAEAEQRQIADNERTSRGLALLRRSK